MSRWILAVIASIIMTGAVYAQQSQKQYVKVQTENFRAAPGGKIIGKVNSGTPMTVISEEGQWMKVRIEGYIWKPSTTSDPTSVEGFQIRAMHILLETRSEAQTILDRLNSGAQFRDMAVQYSVDPSARTNKGDLGYFSRGDLDSEFENIAFKLKVGETSGIVKTKFGFHIIRRTE